MASARRPRWAASCCGTSCPRKVGFDAINKVLDKKSLGALIDLCYRLTGEKETVLLADRIRSLGYTNATRPASPSRSRTWSFLPRSRSSWTSRARRWPEIENQYLEGLITDGERYNKVIDIWAEITEKVAGEMMQQISQEEASGEGKDGKRETRKQPSFNPIYIMADSGARGSRAADPPAGRYARPDGQALRRNHRDAHHGQLP